MYWLSNERLYIQLGLVLDWRKSRIKINQPLNIRCRKLLEKQIANFRRHTQEKCSGFTFIWGHALMSFISLWLWNSILTVIEVNIWQIVLCFGQNIELHIISLYLFCFLFFFFNQTNQHKEFSKKCSIKWIKLDWPLDGYYERNSILDCK